MITRARVSTAAIAACALFGASGANAAIGVKAGDWDLEFSGNVNAFATNASCDDPGPGTTVAGGLACVDDDDDVNVRTGLLPSWFGFAAKTRANELDVGVTLGFQPGVDSGQFINGLDRALGLNTANFRQVFLTVGDKGWGTVKFGRDLGIFASEALLSDMTLLGVGSGASGGGGNTALGRIGTGYLYPDWKGQISYASPKLGGLSFEVGLMDPFGLVNFSGLSGDASLLDQANDSFGYEAEVQYGWEGNWPGKVWTSFLSQKIDAAIGGFTASGFDVGAKIAFAGFEAVAYWYTGDGIGTTAYLFDAASLAGRERESDGGYVQLTYKLPGPGTKLGVSYGESNLDRASGEAPSALVEKNSSTTFGVYHPLNKYVNLVLEFTATKAEAQNGNEADQDTIAIGAIFLY